MNTLIALRSVQILILDSFILILKGPAGLEV